MVYFVIAGISDCVDFQHVCYVADYLSSKLPNIELKKIPMDKMDWGNFLEETNFKNNWHHMQSPLVYKELKGFGTHAHLIGGISEFWEYCFDYYGLESLLSKEELNNLQKDNVAFNEKLDKDSTSDYRNVFIYGPKTRFLWLLLAELYEIEGLPKSKGFTFTFYNDSPKNFDEPEQEFEDIIDFLNSEYNTKAIRTESLYNSFDDCELMIITEHFPKTKKGIASEIIAMNRLGDAVIHSDCHNLKIVFANYGASCLPATILASIIKDSNIVVVTSDLGLGPLRVVARVLQLDMGKLSGPPVWGFIGQSKIIDLDHIIKKCNVYKLHDRAARVQGSSSLEQGTITTELRFINYLIDDVPDIWTEIRKTKDTMKEKLKRAAVYAKVNATVNLLKLWFAPDQSDEIISLGVVSDGSYKIPIGLVFSQPAMLEKGRWVPFPGFPTSPRISKKIHDAVKNGLELLHS